MITFPGPSCRAPGVVVHEHPAAQIFPDVIFVVGSVVLIDPVWIAFLPLADGCSTGYWSQTRYGDRVPFAWWSLWCGEVVMGERRMGLGGGGGGHGRIRALGEKLCIAATQVKQDGQLIEVDEGHVRTMVKAWRLCETRVAADYHGGPWDASRVIERLRKKLNIEY